MSSIQVFKFGGTSLGTPENIKLALDIVKKRQSKLIVVVSAMGGITDRLLDSANTAATGDLQTARATCSEFKRRHEEAIDELVKSPMRSAFLKKLADDFTTEFDAICKSLSILKEHTPRILDVSVARGERMMAQLFSAALEECDVKSAFIDATELIYLERKLGTISPDWEKSSAFCKSKIPPLFEDHDVVLVPGFIGTGPDQEIMTLGRSGTDYSATILANCIDADQVVFFKEVDGMLTTDPRFVENARVIPELHYREATELAYYGANVLHPRTIIPLLDKKIPLIVKNSFSPDFPGTTISAKVSGDSYPVKALTAIPGQALITVEGNGMIGVPGIAGRTFTTMAGGDISVSVISQASSEASICFVVPNDQANEAIDLLHDAFKYEIAHRLIDKIYAKKDLAVVAVVGMGMKGVPGIAARTFSSVSRAEINIVTIAQGSSELNISFAVEESQMQAALKALHREYQLDKMRALPYRKGREATVTIFGFGQIGRTLAKQISTQTSYLKQTYQTDFHCIALADRSGLVVNEEGYNSKQLEELINLKKNGKALVEGVGQKSLAEISEDVKKRIFQLPMQKGIFTDLTAEESAPIILEALKNGMHVALANKKPLAIPQADFDELFATARENGVMLRYEATVGAGLPVLDTLEKLASAGDEVDVILGCLSGTLGYLMTELEDGVSYSESVAKAYKLGYTEPDPREDLSGMDVARKALILSRTLGRRINIEDIKLEPLFPSDLSDDDPHKFIENLKKLDEEFNEKIKRASSENRVLRYVARIERQGVSVGIEAVERSSPLGRLRGTDNQVTIKTRRYDANPLIVTGPGAGAEVTAAGVLNDIVAIATSASPNGET